MSKKDKITKNKFKSQKKNNNKTIFRVKKCQFVLKGMKIRSNKLRLNMNYKSRK